MLKLTPNGRSDYSKLVAYVNKEHFYPERMGYFDRGDNKVKEAAYTFKNVGDYWNPAEIVMKDLKNGHMTRMQTSDVEFDTGLSDDEFTVRKLKQ